MKLFLEINHMVKAIVHLMVSISVIFAFIGCKEIRKGTINSYVEVSYDPGSIKQVAVFSIKKPGLSPSELSHMNNRIIASMSRQIDTRIINSITSKNPEIGIISPYDALKAINKSGLTGEWNDLVDDYYNSGIVNSDVLHEISNALGADAVLLGQLVSVYQTDGNGWDTTGTTIVTVIYSMIEVSTAVTIWEVSADGIVKRQMDEAAPPINEAVDLAIEKVTQHVPRL